MKIKCLHGYFIFEELAPGQVSKFMSIFGLSLVPKENYFTFSDLEDAPDFSLLGLPYLEAVTTKTFAGKPWEIFEANGFVYNYDLGLVVPILSVVQRVSIFNAGTHFLSDGLVLPGSLTDEGKRVKDYAAWFSSGHMRFKYSEVTYVD